MNKFSEKTPGQFSIDDLAGPLAAKQKATSTQSPFADYQRPALNPQSGEIISASAKIKEMQKEIQSFAQYLVMYASGHKNEKPNEAKLDKGKSAILDWIDENFLGAQNIQTSSDAQEFTSKEDEMEYAAKQLRGTSFIEGKNLAQTLTQIGSPKNKSESITDGVWGPRTQNALKIIFMFGDALGNAIDALEGKSEVQFDPRATQYLKAIYEKFNTAEKPPAKDQEKLAGYAISFIQALKKYFQNFINYADRAGLKSYISSGVDGQGPRQPLFTITSGGSESKINQQAFDKIKKDISTGKQYAPIGLNGVNVPVDALLDLNKFQQILMSAGAIKPTFTREQIKTTLLQYIDLLEQQTQVSTAPMGIK